jgi:microcystin-dependent protein
MYSDEPSYDVSTQPTFDNANDPFTRLGLTGGVKRHVLTEAQMPLHSHNPKFHTTATEITYGFYSPPANTTHWIFEGTAGGPFGGRVLVSAVSGRNIPSQYNGVYPSMVENAGSGTRHQNLQPFVVVNYIIKT